MKKSRVLRIVAISILLSFVAQSGAQAASRSKIDAAYKKMYRQMVSANNEIAVAAMTLYDVEVKQAIGKVLDGRVKCDTRSKNTYKSKAFSSLSPEVDQFIFGIYLGYCNAK